MDIAIKSRLRGLQPQFQKYSGNNFVWCRSLIRLFGATRGSRSTRYHSSLLWKCRGSDLAGSQFRLLTTFLLIKPILASFSHNKTKPLSLCWTEKAGWSHIWSHFSSFLCFFWILYRPHPIYWTHLLCHKEQVLRLNLLSRLVETFRPKLCVNCI